MKKWVEKLIEQFDLEWNDKDSKRSPHSASISEERASLLFLIDVYNKHLVDIEGHPVRKVRETLDDFAKSLLDPKNESVDQTLFRFRQFFSSYRVDEVSYLQKTFEEFRNIILDFVDQLSEDIGKEQKEDDEIRQNLDELKDAVESNSIDVLKSQSRKFIDCYVEKQFKKTKRRNTRMKTIRKNLSLVKKQLGDAQSAARTDHLTGAYNRKAFEEYLIEQHKLAKAGSPVSLIVLDIDHFKKINDSYGHDIGDFVLKELVKTLKASFTREIDFVARLGGEEFAIVLPEMDLGNATTRAEDLLHRIRQQAYVLDVNKIQFTVSAGVAQLGSEEDISSWTKRADQALYHSKNTGRNRCTVAPASILNEAA